MREWIRGAVVEASPLCWGFCIAAAFTCALTWTRATHLPIMAVIVLACCHAVWCLP